MLSTCWLSRLTKMIHKDLKGLIVEYWRETRKEIPIRERPRLCSRPLCIEERDKEPRVSFTVCGCGWQWEGETVGWLLRWYGAGAVSKMIVFPRQVRGVAFLMGRSGEYRHGVLEDLSQGSVPGRMMKTDGGLESWTLRARENSMSLQVFGLLVE